MFRLLIGGVLILFCLQTFADQKNIVFHAPSCKSSFRNRAPAGQFLRQEFKAVQEITESNFPVFNVKYWFKRPAKDLLAHIVGLKQEQMFRLARMAQDKRFSKLHRNILSVSHEKMRESVENNLIHLRYRLKNLPKNASWREVYNLVRSDKGAHDFYANLKGFYLNSKSILTETEVALQVSNVSALEIRIKAILHHHGIRLNPREMNNKVLSHSLELEMDVVANNYRDLIEVKTFNTQSDKLVNKLAQHLITKTKHMRALLNFLRNKYGIEMKFHILLIGEGRLDRQSIEKLEALGAFIHYQEFKSIQ